MSAKDDEWFRSPAWDDAARVLFESKLARARSDWNKAQYLRIKSLSLLKSDDPGGWAWGEQLANEVIREYGGGRYRSEAAGALETLGDYQARCADYRAAERSYRRALEEYKGTNFSSDADLRLAELLELTGRHGEAVDLLGEIVGTGSRHFNSVLWRINVCMARALFHLGDRLQAPRNAKKALELMSITEPQLPRHPTMGLVPQDDAVRRELEEIVAACES